MRPDIIQVQYHSHNNICSMTKAYALYSATMGDKINAISVMIRPGPNIPLILPIIQELYSPISTPLFKRKLPITLKKADETSCKRNDTL